MIGAALASRSLVQAKGREHKVTRYPAPMGGIDTRQAIGSENLNQCIYTFNLTPFEYGMRVRRGYREWTIGFDDDSLGVGVRTVLPYESPDGSADDIFVITNEGIWEDVLFDDTPTLAVEFTTKTGNAGYGSYAHYVTDAGATVLFYADAVNGLFAYESGAWAQATGITGPTIADIKFVVVHKERIWFIEEDSTSAWYLGVGAVTGAATEFYFGSKLKHGGTLDGLFNWTIDGGSGSDDQLVFVGHAGDVIVYKGLDPEDSSWDIVGNYFIGEIPATPRFGTEQGGELYLLSAFGLTSMSDLLKGVDTSALEADQSSIAVRVTSLIREDMRTKIDLAGWGIAKIPSEGGLLISTPTIGATRAIQYYYNLAVRGWGIWRDVPMISFDTWQGDVYFGTADNRLMKMDVPVDDFKLTANADGSNGIEIEFSILTAFSALELPALYKRPNVIRPDFLANTPPTHTSQCRFDFNVTEGVATEADISVDQLFGIWSQNGTGISKWDEAVWSSTSDTSYTTVGGSWGLGRYVAIATKGSTKSRTRLIGWDLVFTAGGPMI